MNDRDIDQLLDAWMDLGPTVAPSRVVEAVRLETRSTRQTAIPHGWPRTRFPAMPSTLRFAFAAAAVAAAAVIGFTFFVAPNVGGPGPTVAPSPSQAARSLFAGPLAPGDYQVSSTNYTPVTAEFTVPYGWVAGDVGSVGKNSGGPAEVSLAWFVVTHVYEDACDSAGTLTEVGASADELVAALVAQRNTDIEGPHDMRIGGYPAQRLDIGIPADLDTSACRYPGRLIQIWADAPEINFFALATDSSGSVYVTDVDGQRVVITATYGPEATDEDIAELEAIVASVRFATER